MSYNAVRYPNRFDSDWGRKLLSFDDPTTFTQSPTDPSYVFQECSAEPSSRLLTSHLTKRRSKLNFPRRAYEKVLLRMCKSSSDESGGF